MHPHCTIITVTLLTQLALCILLMLFHSGSSTTFRFGTLCFGCNNMASCNVYACWAKFKREQLGHLLRLGELILSFAIGTITLISYGTQFWVETPDYHHGLWINCSAKPEVPCAALLPLVVNRGKRRTEINTHHFTYTILSMYTRAAFAKT